MADVYLPIGIEAVQAYIDTGTVTPDGKIIVAPLMATSGGGGGSGATEYTLSLINDKLPSLTGNGYLGVELTGNQLALESGGTLSAIDGKLPNLSGGRIPVDIGGSGSITITSGTITVANEVEIKNDSGNPVPVTANAGTNLNTSALALESGGNLAGINTKLVLPSSLGAKTAANSLAVTLATDGVASGISNQIGEIAPNPTANTVLARLQTVGFDTAAIRAQLPTSLGAKTAANSLAVTLAPDGIASGISNQIGEVQGSPTANTVLARLKTIGDNTARANITLSTQNLGTANAGVIKNSSGQVFSVYAENENTAKRYLLLLNQTTAPVNNQVPIKAYGIPANGAIVLDAVYFGANGLSFATGIAWAFSSTKSTVTLATAADCIMEVGYV